MQSPQRGTSRSQHFGSREQNGPPPTVHPDAAMSCEAGPNALDCLRANVPLLQNLPNLSKMKFMKSERNKNETLIRLRMGSFTGGDLHICARLDNKGRLKQPQPEYPALFFEQVFASPSRMVKKISEHDYYTLATQLGTELIEPFKKAGQVSHIYSLAMYYFMLGVDGKVSGLDTHFIDVNTVFVDQMNKFLSDNYSKRPTTVLREMNTISPRQRAEAQKRSRSQVSNSEQRESRKRPSASRDTHMTTATSSSVSTLTTPLSTVIEAIAVSSLDLPVSSNRTALPGLGPKTFPSPAIPPNNTRHEQQTTHYSTPDIQEHTLYGDTLVETTDGENMRGRSTRLSKAYKVFEGAVSDSTNSHDDSPGKETYIKDVVPEEGSVSLPFAAIAQTLADIEQMIEPATLSQLPYNLAKIEKQDDEDDAIPIKIFFCFAKNGKRDYDPVWIYLESSKHGGSPHLGFRRYIVGEDFAFFNFGAPNLFNGDMKVDVAFEHAHHKAHVSAVAKYYFLKELLRMKLADNRLGAPIPTNKTFIGNLAIACRHFADAKAVQSQPPPRRGIAAPTGRKAQDTHVRTSRNVPSRGRSPCPVLMANQDGTSRSPSSSVAAEEDEVMIVENDIIAKEQVQGSNSVDNNNGTVFTALPSEIAPPDASRSEQDYTTFNNLHLNELQLKVHIKNMTAQDSELNGKIKALEKEQHELRKKKEDMQAKYDQVKTEKKKLLDAMPEDEQMDFVHEAGKRAGP
ncbi:hypothetical protein P280DRAFT_550936 [Massarina eburnea CBS 473.64]|uniref:Uncharacterized protein n=1 Tax=Massarina eburnea CBS 473.64 TaxID=1395130 RepID=A0A6A6RVV5_9PLEO|nr:hypothetical protein P280DRAFT_550936 [Massarina eburnea CBS 473.64]